MRTAIESLPTPPAGVKYIPLTKGKFAIVDEADYAWLNQWKWYFRNGYAVRTIRCMKHAIRMHRVVNETPDGFDTDHRNGDKLDNRRRNLRTATKSENKMHQPVYSNNTTGFKGVVWNARDKRFQARIHMNRKSISLGYYTHIEDAAGIYATAAIEYFGEFAKF